VQKLFKYCQEKKFAIPALNITSSSTVVAALEAARDSKSPIILQLSQSGAVSLIEQLPRWNWTYQSLTGLFRWQRFNARPVLQPAYYLRSHTFHQESVTPNKKPQLVVPLPLHTTFVRSPHVMAFQWFYTRHVEGSLCESAVVLMIIGSLCEEASAVVGWHGKIPSPICELRWTCG